MKKRLFITVDTECHDINNQDRYIWGRTHDGENWGLLKILEEGKKLNIPINFFLDVAEADRYGVEFVKGIADIILSYNQPIFLHLHPNFISGDETRTYLWQYDENMQRIILSRAHQIWNELFPSSPCAAFRAGRYGTDAKIYTLLKNEFGEDLIDLSYSTPGGKMCHLTKEEIGVDNVPIKFCGIVLIPNTKYVSLRLFGRQFNLGLDASQTCLGEYKEIMKHNSLGSTILTMHSWNFIKTWFFKKGKVGKDFSALKRFRSMVQYAKNEGYIISDLRDFVFEPDSQDQLIDIWATPLGKIKSFYYNFIRFQRIARLSPKYFFIYTVFYLLVVSLTIVLLLNVL